ncbi:MAG: TRAP transporter large permease subunit, partial [Treponema sp.]|nr:TRAP transporter large permease subunit [Treponema sp.]
NAVPAGTASEGTGSRQRTKARPRQGWTKHNQYRNGTDNFSGRQPCNGGGGKGDNDNPCSPLVRKGDYFCLSRVPQVITESLAPLVANSLLLNVVLQIIILLLGTALDVVPTILIMTPIMLPLLRAANIDVVYFGIVFTLTNVLGLGTPPVVPVFNVACATGKEKLVATVKRLVQWKWNFRFALLTKERNNILNCDSRRHIAPSRSTRRFLIPVIRSCHGNCFGARHFRLSITSHGAGFLLR